MGLKGAVVAAGYGTRFLPVTRVVAKELLPIVDRPAVDLVIAEMVEVGVDEILVVTSRRKRSLDDWFDRDVELEQAVAGDARKSALVRPPAVPVRFVRQAQMGGTGDALRLIRSFAGSDPVLVAFPDDLFERSACQTLVDAWRATGTSVLAAVDLAGEDVSRYGVLDLEGEGALRRVRGVVEKPAPGTEPSTWISLGRFLYLPEMFEALDAHYAEHRGGEYYPMPAMLDLAARGRLHAVEIPGRRWDTGNPLGYLQAVVDAALARPDLAAPFERWLRARLGD